MAGTGRGAAKNWGPSNHRSHRPRSSAWDCPAIWSVTWMEAQGACGSAGWEDFQMASRPSQTVTEAAQLSSPNPWEWAGGGGPKQQPCPKAPGALVALRAVTQLPEEHTEPGTWLRQWRPCTPSGEGAVSVPTDDAGCSLSFRHQSLL